MSAKCQQRVILVSFICKMHVCSTLDRKVICLQATLYYPTSQLSTGILTSCYVHLFSGMQKGFNRMSRWLYLDYSRLRLEHNNPPPDHHRHLIIEQGLTLKGFQPSLSEWPTKVNLAAVLRFKYLSNNRFLSRNFITTWVYFTGINVNDPKDFYFNEDNLYTYLPNWFSPPALNQI